MTAKWSWLTFVRPVKYQTFHVFDDSTRALSRCSAYQTEKLYAITGEIHREFQGTKVSFEVERWIEICLVNGRLFGLIVNGKGQVVVVFRVWGPHFCKIYAIASVECSYREIIRCTTIVVWKNFIEYLSTKNKYRSNLNSNFHAWFVSF